MIRRGRWMVVGLGLWGCVDIPSQVAGPPLLVERDMEPRVDADGPDKGNLNEEMALLQCDPECVSPQICNPTTGRCVACLNDAACELSSTTPFCLEGSCVECKERQDCASNQVCLSTYACAACETSADCTLDPAQSKCLNNTCVECLKPEDCPASRGQCLENRCVECKEDFECLTKPGLLRCQLELNQCVACLIDEHCDLASAQPHCGLDFTCQACKADQDCDYPGLALSCELLTGRCRFKCINSSMCANGQTCAPEGICLPS